MNVMVTGATGFIGSRLVERLCESGATVACHALKSERDRVSGRVDPGRIVTGGATAIADALRAAGTQVVVHLASRVTASDELDEVAPTLAAGVVFGGEVAYAAATADVAAFVNISTYWVHAEGTSEIRPNTPYAVAKVALEPLLDHASRRSGMRVTTLELSDTYGPNDPRTKFLGAVDAATRAGRPLAATPGEQSVSLVHVDDVCSAIIEAARGLLSGGPNRYHSVWQPPVTLREIADAYRAATGRCCEIEWGAHDYPPHQVMRPYFHPNVPGWTPKFDLVSGLRDVYL